MIDAEPAPGPHEPLPRTVAPRRHLPGSRATVGGLLVAVAGLLLYSAARTTPHTPAGRYLVTTRAVPAGTVLRATDLASAGIDLPTGVARQAVSDPRQVVGAVTVAPLGAQQLVTRSAVAPTRPGATSPVLSFSIEADRAADGALVAGDRIDLLVTWSHDADASTELVGHDLEVLRVRRSADHGLGRDAPLTLSVAVPDRSRLVPLVRASRAGELTVVRTTGTASSPEQADPDADPVAATRPTAAARR